MKSFIILEKLKSLLAKTINKGEREIFFSIQNSLELSNAIQFVNPDSLDMDYLIYLLKSLSKYNGKLNLEKPLINKKYRTFDSYTEVIVTVKKELKLNYEEYSKEFEYENDISFSYYIGSSILFFNSVEIIQKVFNKVDSNIGNIFYSMTIKFNDGKYYLWGW